MFLLMQLRFKHEERLNLTSSALKEFESHETHEGGAFCLWRTVYCVC